MRYIFKIEIDNSVLFKDKLFYWANKWSDFCILNSNEYCNDKYAKYEFLAGFGRKTTLKDGSNPFTQIKNSQIENNDWMFGFLGYDLKNYTENLSSNNTDYIYSPDYYFFIPEIVIAIKGNIIEIHSDKSNNIAKSIFDEIQYTLIIENSIDIRNIETITGKDLYIETISKIKSHIQAGDIYEMNFCQAFIADVNTLDSSTLYKKLNSISPTPFSSFARLDGIDVICASPERYIQHSEGIIISQPIKGTIKRGKSDDDDNHLKELLYTSEKDRSENVMIVDLVRNDLSKTAKKASVVVEELFGIYEFPQVYQMISTVKSELKEGLHPIDAIEQSFPMGSMTGAPKIRAMELIEQYESFKRGIYSGCIGYIDPKGNYDFNVIIRSIIYNRELNRLLFAAGGAITMNSDPESEYEESMLKAKAIFEILRF